jgi:hypothetical protein
MVKARILMLLCVVCSHHRCWSPSSWLLYQLWTNPILLLGHSWPREIWRSSWWLLVRFFPDAIYLVCICVHICAVVERWHSCVIWFETDFTQVVISVQHSWTVCHYHVRCDCKVDLQECSNLASWPLKVSKSGHKHLLLQEVVLI